LTSVPFKIGELLYLIYTDGLFQSIRLHYFKKTFLQYTQGPETRVLDYGCGPGDALQICKDLAIQAEGVDSYDYSIELARKRGLKIHKADYNSLPFEKKSFDIILLQSVLEHMKDPVEAVSRLKEYLKPGGVLILSSPTPGPHFWDDPTHIRPYTPKSFHTLAGLTEMKVIKVNYIFSHLLGLTLTASWIYKILNILPFSLGSNILGVFRNK
jgi:2-polyprenyl-3-methyl-5-hydroxy-6-metoxy-1,4-benzoquinol methylase